MATIAVRPDVAAVPSVRAVPRVQSVDLLRGCVMVIMALDHIRDFFHYGAQHYSPEDLTRTTAILFFTRWITHFCAPVFVFLAGTGSYLATRRGRSLPAVSKFLWTRGIWLVAVEMTFVLLGTTFNLSYRIIVWQVIWAIGCSMIVLSVLVFLPWRGLLALSAVMIAGHNLFDGVQPEAFGSLGWLWRILHGPQGVIELGGGRVVLVAYPLVPWIGVMSAGFCFGRVFDLESRQRREWLLRWGLGLTTAFVALRLLNGYGDPSPWSVQPTPAMTLVSFLRVSKYPPSLMFLLMTLGPSLVALSAFERVRVSDKNAILVFGRVPLFYYVIHWYALHLTAIAFAWARYGRFDFLFDVPPSLWPQPTQYPPDYGYELWTVYLVWLAIAAALYPICRWFAGVKARRRSAWLSYL